MGSARDKKANRYVHSINFDPMDNEWVDSIAARLSALGYPKAGRSAVVRAALLDLRKTLAGRSDSDIVRFFLEKDAMRVLTAVDRKENDTELTNHP